MKNRNKHLSKQFLDFFFISCRLNCLRRNSCIKQCYEYCWQYQIHQRFLSNGPTETIRMLRHPSKLKYRESRRIIAFGIFCFFKTKKQPDQHLGAIHEGKLHTSVQKIFDIFHYFTKCNNICLSPIHCWLNILHKTKTTKNYHYFYHVLQMDGLQWMDRQSTFTQITDDRSETHMHNSIACKTLATYFRFILCKRRNKKQIEKKMYLQQTENKKKKQKLKKKVRKFDKPTLVACPDVFILRSSSGPALRQTQ